MINLERVSGVLLFPLITHTDRKSDQEINPLRQTRRFFLHFSKSMSLQTRSLSLSSEVDILQSVGADKKPVISSWFEA